MGLFLSLFVSSFEDRASSSRGRIGRRLISLIFAGRNRIIMIRRELPLTSGASPAEPVALGRRGFSFVLAPAAAGSVLELDCVVHSLGRLCFFILWKAFVFAVASAFAFVLALRQAAIRSLLSASTLTPMAQMKPSSSRPTAVVILRWSLPAAASLA